MKHRHDVAWVRLFGRERPGGWTDRAALACHRHLNRPTGLTAPPASGRPLHPATSMRQRRRCKDAPV